MYAHRPIRQVSLGHLPSVLDTPSERLQPVDLPGLPADDPDRAASLLDAYLQRRRQDPRTDRLAAWQTVISSETHR